MNDTLLQFGIDIKMIIAGFCGGVVHTFVFRQTDPYTAIGSIVAGIVTANYVAASAAKSFGISDGFAGFAVGLSAMAVCQGIVTAAKQFKVSRGGNNNSDGTDK